MNGINLLFHFNLFFLCSNKCVNFIGIHSVISQYYSFEDSIFMENLLIFPLDLSTAPILSANTYINYSTFNPLLRNTRLFSSYFLDFLCFYFQQIPVIFEFDTHSTQFILLYATIAKCWK